jgi:hypothetical protein
MLTQPRTSDKLHSMAENKMVPTAESVQDFLASVEHPVRRQDGETLLALMQRVTGEPAVMWGQSIVGFGSYHYKYASGHEGDAAAVGFSPRKASLSVYGLTYAPGSDALLERLGKHKKAVACVYINKLTDVDMQVLAELIELGYRYMTGNEHESLQSRK